MNLPVPALLREVRAFLRNRFKRDGRYGRAFSLAVLTVVAGTWAFAEIVDNVTEREELYHVDLQARDLFERILTPEGARYVVHLTNTGGFVGMLVLVGIVVLVLMARKRWWAALELAATTALGALVILGLKALFARTRPDVGFVAETGSSYPSGHAFMAVVFYGYLAFLAWQATDSWLWRLPAVAGSLVMIALMGTSRLYLGVHWLTDVLGGYVAGLAWFAASLLVLRGVEHRRASS